MGRRVLLGLAAILAAGCAGAPETGPIEVRWDRNVCARCSMAMSDRHYGAQVRGGPAERKTTVSTFDDLGCAVLWLDEQPWREDARTEIWTTHHQTGEWINARAARYVDGRVSPMDFGLGATTEAVDGSFGWDEAVARIQAKKRARAQRGAARGVSTEDSTTQPGSGQ